MRGILTIVIACATFILVAGCEGSPEVLAIESKAQRLIDSRATTNEVASAFGGAPFHIYTRAESTRFFEATPRDDLARKIWERMVQYPETHSFPMPGGEIQIFFDETGRAAAFHSNIQL